MNNDLQLFALIMVIVISFIAGLAMLGMLVNYLFYKTLNYLKKIISTKKTKK